MNFLALQKALKSLESPRKLCQFLKYLTSNCRKNKHYDSDLRIIAINARDLLGDARRKRGLSCDILFTRTAIKHMKQFISKPFSKLILSLAHDDLSAGKRLRRQGQMHSVLVPNTRQQKVLTFCPLTSDRDRKAYIITNIDEAYNWNSHGRNRSRRNAFSKKANDRCRYYRPLYQQALQLID